MKVRVISACIVTAGALAVALPASANVAGFYQGRTVTIIVGYGPGGGADTYARFAARHLGKFIPGEPSIIVQNMPGAGSLRSVAYTYNAAAKDGTVILHAQPTTLIEPQLGNKSAKWDVKKFSYLGSLARDANSCMASGKSGIRSIKEATGDRQIIVGTTGPSAMDMKTPAVLANLLGYNIKIVSGYTGSDGTHMAMQSGEIDVYCAFWASQAMGRERQNVENGTFVPIVQFGEKPHPIFGDAPVVYDLATTDEQKQLLKFIFGPTSFGRTFVLPPGVPKDRAKALGEAFWKMAQSEEFRADAGRAKLLIDPMTADETEAALAEITSVSPDIVTRAVEAMRGR